MSKEWRVSRFSETLPRVNLEEEIKIAFSQNLLMPKVIENYWNGHYRGYESEMEQKIKVPRFPDTAKEVREHTRLGMMPILIPEQAVDSEKGFGFLKEMYGREVDMYDVPSIKNEIQKSGWRYVQLNPSVGKEELANALPGEEVRNIDFPAYVTLSVFMKKVWGQFPDQHMVLAKDNNIATSTWTRLGGSSIVRRFKANEGVEAESVPAVYFGAGNKLVCNSLEQGEKYENLINRSQILINPIKPRKVAPFRR